MKKLMSMIMIFALIFSFANIGSAAGMITKVKTEDGRTQIIMEFDDSKEAEWALEYIAKMQAKKIFTGYGDGTFRPNQPVKRVEAIVTAVRLMGLEEEAKAKSLDTKLYFKDAEQINHQYRWAKGYIIVALENGLFDTSEDKLLPDKPASRLWVSSLLVRALGLQEEALSQMTASLDFKDAKAIPAGSIGYVKVASDLGIVTGYPNGTFQPNKNVTRAEMAALLDRTSDNYLEENGAVHVRGTIISIDFDDEETITDHVYTDGKIKVRIFDGDSFTYKINSDLLVQYKNRFIEAEDLKVGDIVSLAVKDGIVVEAALLDQASYNQNLAGIYEMELKIKYGQDNEYQLKYENDDGKTKAKIQSKLRHRNHVLNGPEGVKAAEELLEQFDLSPEMSKGEILSRILEALDISIDDVEELEMEIKFSNGTKTKIPLENDDDESDEEDED